MSEPGVVIETPTTSEDVVIETGHAAAAVEIAEIQAAAHVEIAEIDASLEQARIDTAAGVATETIEERLAQCQLNLETMQSQTQGQITALAETMATELASIRQLLEERTQPPQQQPQSGEGGHQEVDEIVAPAVTQKPKAKPIRVV